MCFLAFNQMHIRILDAFHDFSCFLFLCTCRNHENQFAPSIHQINFRNSRCCIYMNRNASNASRCISNTWFWSLLTTSYFNLLLTGSLYIGELYFQNPVKCGNCENSNFALENMHVHIKHVCFLTYTLIHYIYIYIYKRWKLGFFS